MTLWLIMLGIGILTYGVRLSFILLMERIEVPNILLRALRFVPVAVFSAIIFPELLVHEGVLNLSLNNARLLAGILAALVAWRTKNVVFTILVGMTGLLVLNLFLK
jgi:branched-subunit amino acid transport protein